MRSMTTATVIKADLLQSAICTLISYVEAKQTLKNNCKLNLRHTQNWRPFVSFLSFHLFSPQVYLLQKLGLHLGDRYHLLRLKGGKFGPHLQFLRVTGIVLHFSMSVQCNLTGLQHILVCPMLHRENHLVQQKEECTRYCQLNKKHESVVFLMSKIYVLR